MRSVWTVLVLALGLGLATDGWAITKEKLDKSKEEYKEAKDRWKDVSKLAEKWDKAHEKGKETADLDAELEPFYKEDIDLLRDAGVEVRPDPNAPPPPGVTEGGKPEDVIDTEPRDKLEELRSVVVPLKDGEVKGKDKAKALNQYAKILEDRYNRKLAQYEKDKEEYKTKKD